MTRPNQFDTFVDYARARFGDSATVRIFEDTDENGNLGNSSLLLSNSSRSADVEIVPSGRHFLLLAESLRFEPRESGPEPILWALDLVMTFGMEQVRGPFVRRTIVAAPGFLDKRRIGRGEIVQSWAPWNGEIQSRATVAQLFKHPEEFAAPKLQSVEFLPQLSRKPR